MKLFDKLTISQKIFCSNLTYVFLLIITGILFYTSHKQINKLSTENNVSRDSLQTIASLIHEIDYYISGKNSYENLRLKVNRGLSELQDSPSQAVIAAVWEDIKKVNELRELNYAHEETLDNLSETSIENSNTYVREVSLQLIDPEGRKQVNDLQRQTLIGANLNTWANLQIKYLFQKLKQSLDYKDQMFGFLNTLGENVERDRKALEGTPFEALAEQALESNREIISLTDAFVKNQSSIFELQESIQTLLENEIKKIEEASVTRDASFFSSVIRQFRNLIISIVICATLGLVSSLLIVRFVNNSLTKVITGLKEGASQIKEAVNQITNSSQDLAEGTSRQAASLEETLASLDEMTSVITRDSESASTTAQRAQNANSAVAAGVNSMEKLKEGADEASSSASELSLAMDGIKESSDGISKIIKTIDEIAFQTNILALNAAVEAARAGEAGAGFAVVADEVRSLAQRAADAASETQELIENSVTRSERGVRVNDAVNSKLKQVLELADGVGDALASIEENVSEVDTSMNELQASLKEQKDGIGQINIGINQTNEVTQSNAAGAQENASASQQLFSQSEQLLKLSSDLVKLTGSDNINTYAVQNVQHSAISKVRTQEESSRNWIISQK